LSFVHGRYTQVLPWPRVHFEARWH
jgi:hypothetical protein